MLNDMIEWFKVKEKNFDTIQAVILEGYNKALDNKDSDARLVWRRADKFKIVFRATINETPYSYTRYITETLFHNSEIFSERLKWWSNNLAKYMSKVLKIKDFEWLVINKEKADGYYSFKQDGWEICMDYSYNYGWTVTLCNRWEEALEEYVYKNKRTAMEKINEIYRSFATRALE